MLCLVLCVGHVDMIFSRAGQKNTANLHSGCVKTALGYNRVVPTQNVHVQRWISSQSFLYFLLKRQVRRGVAGTGLGF